MSEQHNHDRDGRRDTCPLCISQGLVPPLPRKPGEARTPENDPLFWDWSKGDPPTRPGEKTVTFPVHTRRGGVAQVSMHQASLMPCPFCGRTVIRAATGRDPHLRQRYYYDRPGRGHWRDCTSPVECRKGIRLDQRTSL